MDSIMLNDRITKIEFNGYGRARLLCHNVGWVDLYFTPNRRVTVENTNIPDDDLLAEVVAEFKRKEF